jgi:hypothetical protein
MNELTNRFYIQDGLYNKLKVDNSMKDSTFKLIFTPTPLDCHCIECNKQSIFKPTDNWPFGSSGLPCYRPSGWDADLEKSRILIQKEFVCSRLGTHKMSFLILIEKSTIQKIGQYPSASDLNIDHIKSFKNILKNDYFKEYSKAIGLFSHGIGIGSFVYLRRIIESFIINPALEEARKDATWDELEYQKKRAKERIEALKSYLPEYLVSNKILYSVLSKGIHELSEEECLEYFPVVQSVIDLILTEMKDKIEIEKKKQDMQAKLFGIAGKIS